MPQNTHWNDVAKWYGSHLQNPNTYQHQVIWPGVIKLLQPKAGKHYLDIACGEGSFAQLLIKQTKAEVTGFDAAPQLVTQAKHKALKHATFMVGDATHFPDNIRKQKFAGASCILALQNIEQITPVFTEAAKVLEPGSPLVLVINHPAFRNPRQSGWAWDEQRKLQYRRVDSYLTPNRIGIQAHPGKRVSETTISFHRPLQDYVTALARAGFAITALEEWISPRRSQIGPRAKAEDRARMEFPLFLAIKAQLSLCP